MVSLSKALGLKWEGHSPESKFVYLKLVHQHLSIGKIVAGLVELAKSINVNKKTLSKAIIDLKNRKLISTKKVNGKGIHAGRKKVKIDLLALETDTIFTEESLIVKLIESTSMVTSVKQRKTNSSLLLLIIIIASKANEFGVVTNLPKSKLKQLTGFTESRLKSQLSKLADIGIIQEIVSGLSGKYAFGKVNSYYFIDLNHDLISMNNEYLIIEYNVICYTNNLGAKLYLDCHGESKREQSRRNIRNKRDLSIPKVPIDTIQIHIDSISIESIKFDLNRNLFEFFKDRNAMIFARYFQTVIEQITSTTINDKSIEDYSKWSIAEERIEQLFLPKHMQIKHSMVKNDLENFKSLIQQVVIEYSMYVSNILNHVYGNFSNQMKHMIISRCPKSTGASTLKVISLIENKDEIPTEIVESKHKKIDYFISPM
tara:strand:- start:617 stop:1900 length:1284 start_codon:yes stop_codon:yes gene_type:complete